MNPIICFIDDSDFEHELVRDDIAPCAPGMSFVQGYTFDEIMGLMGDKMPALFLLDLWGQDPDVKEPYITPKAELEKDIDRFKTLDSVFEGLNEFQGDRINLYLKRLFTIVNNWRNLFEEVCNRIGQNRKYGLINLRLARELFPGTPAVFYTRKSLINDAAAMFQAGADGLFIKPTGKDDSETRILTRKYAPQLIKELTRIIDVRKDHSGTTGGP